MTAPTFKCAADNWAGFKHPVGAPGDIREVQIQAHNQAVPASLIVNNIGFISGR